MTTQPEPKTPKLVRVLYPPVGTIQIVEDTTKSDAQLIREGYLGSQTQQSDNTPSIKTVVSCSNPSSDMRMIFAYSDGKWSMTFEGLKEFIQKLIDEKQGDAQKFATDIITESLHPFSSGMKEAIRKILIEDFGFTPKGKGVREALSEGGEPTRRIGSKHFEDNPEWSSEEREKRIKEYFRDLVEHGVYEE